MSPDPDRLQLVDFIGPIAVETYHFIHTYPKEESRIYGPIRPYKPQVPSSMVNSMNRPY